MSHQSDGPLRLLDGAIWRPIPGWPYEASIGGLVRRATDGSGTRAGRVLKSRQYPNGYLYVCLRDRPRTRYAQVHALIAEAFLGRRAGEMVNHLDGNKLNNGIGNLELTDAPGNGAHAAQRGLVQQGERHYGAKLTAVDVSAIRTAVKAGVTQRALAKTYGVSRSAISHVLSGKNWRTVA